MKKKKERSVGIKPLFVLGVISSLMILIPTYTINKLLKIFYLVSILKMIWYIIIMIFCALFIFTGIMGLLGVIYCIIDPDDDLVDNDYEDEGI